MRIKNILKRCVATALAAVIGMTTLATGASAAASGINIGYTWDTSVNPHISVKKSAKSGGVEGQYIKAGEQICRFVPSSGSDWAFCIEPARSMQGTHSGNWYTQYGFTKYDTFDLTDKNKADSLAYWKKIGGTGGSMSTYLGLVQYYGYSSHKNGNYYAATQLIIWEMILGYRGHNQSTFGTCSDVLWNDFTYPSGGWCTKSGVEKAYNDIVANVKNHYKLPTALKLTKAQAKDEPALLLKYNVPNMRYQAKFNITSDYVSKSNLLHNFSTLESKLTSLVKSKFTGTFGKDYGIEKSENNGVTTFTVWSKNRPFTSTSDSSIYTTDAVELQMKSDLKAQETLFASSNYQTCLLSTKLDPVSGYVGLAAYNEPNLTVEKTFTDSSNNAITATELSDLLGKTTFVIYCVYDNVKYYVQADKDSAGTGYVFKKYVKSESEATKFKTLKNTSNKGTFTVSDLPTSSSQGRTYRVSEYSVPDSDRYEKLSKTVLLPSPTSNFTANAGTKTLKFNNSEISYDAKFGTATLDKIIENGSGKTLSSDDESNISTLANIYKSTKFIVGYWNGSEIRYLTNGYTSAKNAFSGDLADLNNFNDKVYKSGDGMYYVPTKLNSDHKLIFNDSRTSTDISKAYVFSTGYNFSGTETCDYFGEIFLNFLPLDSNNNAQEIMFIEVNGAANYGYDESIDMSKNVYTFDSLKTNSDKRNISGLLLNDSGKSYTVTDESGKSYSVGSGKFYPISANKLENNKLHSDAEIVNQLVHYDLILTKKDGDSNEVLQGARYGLYDSNKRLLTSATTGNDGKAHFNYDLLPNTNYYVHEISAPSGYVLDNEFYLVNKANAAAVDLDNFQNAKIADYNYTVNDKPYKLKIEVNKYDVINDVKIEGIEFDVSLNGKTVGTMKTNSDGYASIEDLPLGKLNGSTFENVYVITEKENDKYIMIDEDGKAAKTITVTTTLSDIENLSNPVITYSADVPNTLQTVDLKVHKIDEFNNPIKDVVFEIAPTKDVIFNGKTVQKAGEKIGTITTDSNGIASNNYTEFESDGTQGYDKIIPIYPNFEYQLTEVSAPAPYVITNKITKFTAVSESAKTMTIPYEVTVPNAHQHGVIDVFKQDNETKKPLADAEFEVRAAEDLSFGNTKIHSKNDLICTMKTGADGHATTGDAVMYVGAKYVLTETKAPEGYKLNGASKTFEFNFAGNSAKYSNLKIDFDNDSQKGKITIHKTGDVFSDVTALAAAVWQDKDGTVHESGQTTYTPNFEKAALANAEFEIAAAEDIVTADGTLRAKKGDIVANLTTDANGYAESTELYLGKYNVRETKAPDGYVLNHEVKTVELTYAGQEIDVAETVDSEFFNDYQSVKIHLAKFMEHDDIYNVGGNSDVKNVVFGLFAAEEITAADGSAIAENGLVSTVGVGENMTAEFNTKIPFGKYYVKEIATDEKYVLNGEKYLVTFEYAGQDIPTVDIDCGTFENGLKRGSVSGKKVNEHGEPIANAVFGIFRADCEIFNNETAIATSTSDENGNFAFKNIPYGEYVVTEIQSPVGYVFSDKKYDVLIDENGKEIEITAVNLETHLNVSKKDIYGSELPGAAMQIIDSEGNIFDEWVSDGAEHIVTKIPAGRYTLHEIASPNGYVVSTDIAFSIDEFNAVTVENVDALATDENGIPTIVMVDDTTKIEVSKTAVIAIENETEVMNFSDFNDDEEVQKVYDFLLEIGFTEDEINTIYSDEVSGKIDDEYMMGVVGEKSLDLSKLAELLAMKEDGRLGKLAEKYAEYIEYIAENELVSEELVGAVLQIIDKDGNVVDEWTTTAEKHFIEAKLTAGETYILHEVSAPDGYVLVEDIEFTVSEDGSVNRILMLDDSTKVHISKTDITGDKELEGAKLQVIDENGNVVDEWISTTEQHIIEGKLVAGKEYTLHEEIAPDGYVVANDITFTVSEDGSVDVVVMKDDTTKVRISKRDITTDEELPGAKLQIIDGDTVVEEWTSTSEAHFIEGKLVAGKEYILREITAPDGYETASDVTFTVNEDGSVTEVVMYDEHTPETPKTPNPHTGNDDRVMNVSLAVMAVCGCVMIMAKRRKKDKQR